MHSTTRWIRSRHDGLRILATVTLLVTIALGSMVPETSAVTSDTSSHHSMQSTATLELTMRGCPEGILPQNVNPPVICTEPLDAPDVSVLSWNGGSPIPVPYLERSWEGTYRVSVPGNTPITLSGFAPVLRDGFLAVGADGVSANGDPVITLAPGTTRHIGIYYYYNVPGSGASTSETDSVSIITSIVGWPYTSACYELVGFGEPVCSEMVRDMTYASVFHNVPPGTYTVRQTSEIDDGYVPDFEIEVTGGDQEFWTDVVMAWGSPSRLGAPHLDAFDIEPIPYDSLAPGFYDFQANHVSVVFIDTVTREKVVSNACVQVVDVSAVTCDNERGQIDILDVPVGDHELVVTELPEGYKLAPGMVNLRLKPIGRNPHAPVHIAYFIDVSPELVSAP